MKSIGTLSATLFLLVGIAAHADAKITPDASNFLRVSGDSTKCPGIIDMSPTLLANATFLNEVGVNWPT